MDHTEATFDTPKTAVIRHFEAERTIDSSECFPRHLDDPIMPMRMSLVSDILVALEEARKLKTSAARGTPVPITLAANVAICTSPTRSKRDEIDGGKAITKAPRSTPHSTVADDASAVKHTHRDTLVESSASTTKPKEFGLTQCEIRSILR
ncbi:hypothetical protein BDV98DRAFT_569423 [Pterulicium gracile]|uniref:Uncharacterized protein n=1 Tax=Pterulicium gracile TaxID=1884261 RepID=A0A5C3QF41_9AGAR|nr:hypothetical protein BDV98DRAFT_569423 [Pterula gracilis]